MKPRSRKSEKSGFSKEKRGRKQELVVKITLRLFRTLSTLTLYRTNSALYVAKVVLRPVGFKLINTSVNLPPDVDKNHRIYVDYPDPYRAIKEFSCEILPSQLKIGDIIGQGESFFSYKQSIKFICFGSLRAKIDVCFNLNILDSNSNLN